MIAINCDGTFTIIIRIINGILIINMYCYIFLVHNPGHLQFKLSGSLGLPNFSYRYCHSEVCYIDDVEWQLRNSAIVCCSIRDTSQLYHMNIHSTA